MTVGSLQSQNLPELVSITTTMTVSTSPSTIPISILIIDEDDDDLRGETQVNNEEIKQRGSSY